jgi:long-chain acyl-CoA synthetase
VRRAVDSVNDGRSRYEQIKRYRVLARDFTIEDGELTPTLKLRRKVALEHFADDLEALYAD